MTEIAELKDRALKVIAAQDPLHGDLIGDLYQALLALERRVEEGEKAHTRVQEREAAGWLEQLSAVRGENERMRAALIEIRRLKPTAIGQSGFVTGPALLIRRAQEIAREATKKPRARQALSPSAGEEV